MTSTQSAPTQYAPGWTAPIEAVRREADILIVDDDDGLRREMAAYLSAHGYRVHQAPEARTARRILKAEPI
jgi:two-component system OmpR family response regulator